MVSFISCVNDDDIYSECVKYINAVPVEKEIIPIRKAISMTSGYNTGQRRARGDIKIYLHQDTLIVNKNIVTELEMLFSDSSIGVVGVIGAKTLPRDGVWWNSEEIYGRVLHHCEAESVVDSVCKKPRGEYETVEVVDGLFMATRYDISWDESYDGWHFYDVVQCQRYLREGYKVIVPRQDDFWCIHCPAEKPLDKAYEKYRRLFVSSK